MSWSACRWYVKETHERHQGRKRNDPPPSDIYVHGGDALMNWRWESRDLSRLLARCFVISTCIWYLGPAYPSAINQLRVLHSSVQFASKTVSRWKEKQSAVQSDSDLAWSTLPASRYCCQMGLDHRLLHIESRLLGIVDGKLQTTKVFTSGPVANLLKNITS